MVTGKANTWPFPHGKEWGACLRKQLADYFGSKGIPASIRYPYIIEKHSATDWHKNIIVDRVWKHIEYQKKERQAQRKSFALHKYIHHGLSSQAFLFNLLGPLVVDKQWYIFNKIINQAGIQLLTNITDAEFEFEDRDIFKEQQAQPTSIDLCLYTREAPKVFIEFKSTERNFAGCSVFNSGDCDGRNPAKDFNSCHLHHIGRRY